MVELPGFDSEEYAQHLADARRGLLERWLMLIEDAVRYQDKKAWEMHRANNGPITPPPLVIQMPSQDMIGLLIGGLKNVLDDDKDPFGIAQPARGNKPAYDRMGTINVVREVLGEIKKNEETLKQDGALCYGKKDVITEAIATVADRHKLSADTVKGMYRKKHYLGWARLHGPLIIDDD